MRLVLGIMLTVGIAVATGAADAQAPAKASRIGFLSVGALESPEMKVTLEAFREGLRGHGYVEGQNILVEYRTASSIACAVSPPSSPS